MPTRLAKLEASFKALALIADGTAKHFTVALAAHEGLRGFPLAWEVPVRDEAETGFPADALWHINFRFLCEIAHAIVAYAGFSRSFLEELTYIRSEPQLSGRLLFLNQDAQLYFPDRDDEQWPLEQIATVLARID